MQTYCTTHSECCHQDSIHAFVQFTCFSKAHLLIKDHHNVTLSKQHFLLRSQAAPLMSEVSVLPEGNTHCSLGSPAVLRTEARAAAQSVVKGGGAGGGLAV